MKPSYLLLIFLVVLGLVLLPLLGLLAGVFPVIGVLLTIISQMFNRK